MYTIIFFFLCHITLVYITRCIGLVFFGLLPDIVRVPSSSSLWLTSFRDRGGEEGGSRGERGPIGPAGRIGPAGSKGDVGKESVRGSQGVSGEIVEQKDLKVIKELLDQKAIAVHRDQRDLLVQ